MSNETPGVNGVRFVVEGDPSDPDEILLLCPRCGSRLRYASTSGVNAQFVYEIAWDGTRKITPSNLDAMGTSVVMSCDSGRHIVTLSLRDSTHGIRIRLEHRDRKKIANGNAPKK